jgi:hypothetical protein
MAGTQSIGNLAAIITGDAAQIMGVLNQVQTRLDQMNQTVTNQAPLTEKSATRAGVAMYGLNAIFRAGGAEVMHVINNIERIPGIPADTVASVQMFKGQISELRLAVDGLIAKGAAGFSQFATSLGASIGGMIYGMDNVDDAMKALQDDLEKARKSTPEYRAEIERLGDQLHKIDEQRKTLYGSKGFQLSLLGDQAAGLEAAAKNFPDDDMENMRRRVQAALDLLAVDQGVLAMKRELSAEEERTSALEIKSSEATLSPRERLAALLEREKQTREDLAYYADLYAKTNNPQALDLELQARRKLNAELVEQASLEAKIGELANEVGKAIGSSLEQAMLQGEGLRATIRGLGQDLERVLVHNLFTVPISDSISKGASGVLDSVSKYFGGFFADGGTLQPGEWGIAGENGPEPIFGGTSGMTVVPAAATRGTGGGNSTFYIDARGADRSGLAALASQIRALNGSIEYRAVAAVVKYKRGGPSAAFG